MLFFIKHVFTKIQPNFDKKSSPKIVQTTKTMRVFELRSIKIPCQYLIVKSITFHQELSIKANILFLRRFQVIFYLYNKTRHVAYSRPNGWTDWAEICVNTQGWPGSVRGYKKIRNIFFNFLKTFFSRATPGTSASSL